MSCVTLLKLVGRGSVITGASQSSFLIFPAKFDTLGYHVHSGGVKSPNRSAKKTVMLDLVSFAVNSTTYLL